MSATGTVCVNDVWRKLRDTGGEHVVDEDTIRQALMDNVMLVASEVGVGTEWVSPAFTTTTTARDFTLTANEYGSLIALRYSSDERPLTQVSPERIRAARGNTGASHGRQYEYSVAISPTQEVEIAFAGYPSAAEGVDALVNVVPSDWPKGNGTVPTIPFSRKGIKGLVLLTAAAVYDLLGDDHRTSLDLGKDFGKSTAAQGMALVRAASVDATRIKRATGDEGYIWLIEWSRS